MKKIVFGFIALGLLTLTGCDKDDDSDMETNDNQEANTETTVNTDVNTETSDNTETEPTDDASSIQYGEGLTDGDGNTYKTVIIGEQEWMAENLRTTKYSDGGSIPNITDSVQWVELETDAWSYYNNDNKYDSIYGKLYNWYAVETEKLCPTGWHIPTDAEWTLLTDFLTANGHSEKEGLALKASSGWNDWFGYNGSGTDDYGWNGDAGGFRSSFGDFVNIGNYGIWWSSSNSGSSLVWNRNLHYTNEVVGRGYAVEEDGVSVRCLKD